MSDRRGAPLATRLDELLAADVVVDLRDSVAANTWDAYRSDLTDFEHWCRTSRRVWSTPDSVAAYFRALEDAGAAYATIVRRKTAIAKLVEAETLLDLRADEQDPTKHPKVAVTLKAIRRRIGADQARATPLTADRLLQVILAIDGGTLAGQRDVVLLLIGWYGAFRRSELAGLRTGDLRFDEHGLGIELAQSKTAQDHAVWVPILRQPQSRFDPVGHLEDWLETLALRAGRESSGDVWVHITKGDTLGQAPRAISADAINNIVARRVRAAGLSGWADYSAHSLRSGFVTEAKNRGIDEADIMKHTRHTSLATMRLYDRTSGWWNRNATASMAL